MKKLNKCLATLIGMSLVIGMMGTLAFAGKKDLTPYEFLQLSPQEKVKYKTIILRWPSWLGGDGVASRAKEKEWKKFDEVYVSGDTKMPIEWYSKALFMLTHPKVKIEPGFLSWYPKEMMPAIAAGTASCITPLDRQGGPWGWKEMGLLADITDLVKDWDQAKYLMSSKARKNFWQIAWIDGRCYGVPLSGACIVAIAYRRDLCKEVGIFNEKGEPGPSWNWTWEDFRNIARKLTNVKKKRWGISIHGPVHTLQLHWPSMVVSALGMTEQYVLAIPDKSGEHTWKFEVIPPLVKAHQFLQDMRWKDKSLLFDIGAKLWHPLRKDFMSGRAAMALEIALTNNGNEVSPFNSKRKFSEDIGLIPIPCSFSSKEKGIRAGAGDFSLWGFTSNLDKEELKAAFEYFDWICCGRGKTLALERIADLYPLIGKEKRLCSVRDLPEFYIYKVRDIPPHLPRPVDLVGEKSMEEWRALSEVNNIRLEQPYPSAYGLRYNILCMPYKSYPYLQAAYQTIMTNPNADVRTELERVAAQINKECFDFKIKDDKEKFKEYYTAMAEYVKEYYPDFYQSENFKEMWEKYYKVW